MSGRASKNKRRREAQTTTPVVTRPSGRRWPLILIAALLVTVVVFIGFRDRGEKTTRVAVPQIDTTAMQPRVAQRIEEQRAKVVENPGSPVAWGGLGAACDAHNLYPCAIAAYEEAGLRSPREFRWPYFQAIVSEKHGLDNDQVLALFRRAEKLRPDFAPLRFRMGEMFMRQGLVAEARSQYAKSIELDSDLAAGYLGLGQALIQLDRPEEAIESLQKAMELGGDDQRVFAGLAQAYGLAGNVDAAGQASDRIADARQVIVLPDSERALVGAAAVSSDAAYERAKAFMAEGRFTEALEQLRIVEEAQPNFAGLHRRLGVTYLRTGRRDLALIHLEKAVSLADDKDGARGMLAALLSEQGRLAEAIDHYRIELQEHSQSVPLTVGLAQALIRNDDPKSAAAELARLADSTEMTADAEFIWATALIRTGEPASAIERCEAALRLEPDHAGAHQRMAQALDALGRSAEAADYYRRARELKR